MKILQISSEGNYGSVGTIADKIGEMALDAGHESYIAIGDYFLPSKSHIYLIRNYLDRYFHFMKTRIFDKNGLGSRRATRKLVKWIAKISPDIIHIHQLHGYFINYEILFEYLVLNNLPVVMTLHDCWTFTGHCAYFESVSCDKWKTQCNECPLIGEYPKSYIYDNSANNYELKKYLFNSVPNMQIVTVSNWLSSKVGSSFLNGHPRKVIYNGIDMNMFSHKPEVNDYPFSSELNEKYIILGVASPWNYRKGLDDFIELSKWLFEDEVIVLIGLTKKQIKKLPYNIVGIEKIRDKYLLAKYYRNSNLFINFSVEETFGLTTVESMSCGTPVIVYNSTACPELVSDGTGFIVDKFNFLAVRKIISDLKSGIEQNVNSENCVKWVNQKFNSNDRFKEYIDLYEEIINNIKV